MDLLLRVDAQDTEPFTYRCESPSVVIGRSKTADLTLPNPDPYVSRRHARLFREGDQWFVEDLGSRNTTRLNDREVLEPERVRSGDQIQIGNCVIHIEAEQDKAVGETLDAPAEVFRPAAEVISGIHSQATLKEQGEHLSGRYTARLKTLNQVHQALASSISREDLLELVLDRAFAHLRPEEAVIYQKDAAGEYHPVASRQLPDLEGELVFSERLTRSVSEKGLAALVTDLVVDKTWADARSLINAGVRSLVAAPLVPSEGEPGMIVLTSRSQVRRFSEEDRELLVSLASVAALRLGNIALHEEAARRREIDKELAVAREIQLSLLPGDLPDLSTYELFAKNAASRTISGDMYQVFERRDEKDHILMIADVSGKGVPASLVSASLEALAASTVELGQPPELVLERVSQRLYGRTPIETYATAIIAVLRPADGVVHYVNAGHFPGLVIRNSGDVERLEATGVPLGLFPTAEYSLEETVLDRGEALVLYTDGIPEATNLQDEAYGLERLEAICRENRREPAEKLAASVWNDLEDFAEGLPFADDRTLLLARRR